VMMCYENDIVDLNSRLLVCSSIQIAQFSKDLCNCKFKFVFKMLISCQQKHDLQL